MNRTLLNSCNNSRRNYHRYITKGSGVNLVCVNIQKLTSLSRVYKCTGCEMADLDLES